MYRMVSPHRVISWPICSVTLTEFVRSHAPVQLAPSHVPDRLFRRENSVNVTQQFSEETGIFSTVFWYVCSWIAQRSASRRSLVRNHSIEEGRGRSCMMEAICCYFTQEGCYDLAYANRDGWRCVCRRVTGAVDSRAIGARRYPYVRPATHRRPGRRGHVARWGLADLRWGCTNRTCHPGGGRFPLPYPTPALAGGLRSLAAPRRGLYLWVAL